MSRYIEADALQRRICGAKCGCEHEDCGCEGDCAFEHFIFHAPTADVVPSIELYNELDRFKNDLVNTFIDLCRGNDYNKLTLLKIGDTIDAIYDKRIDELNNKYPEGEK